MKTISHIIYSTFAVFSLACFAFAQQAPDSVSIRVITTFDYPAIGNEATQPQKINDTGEIVGSYFDSNGMGRGFIRFRNGNFSAPIVDPNDTCNVTEGRGINNSHLICGSYQNGSDCPYHGYFLMGSNFSDFDVPGSLSTQVLGVNNVGDFAGGFSDAAGNNPAFVSLGGTITPFSLPGASLTLAYQLNRSNQTEGTYMDSSGILHGY